MCLVVNGSLFAKAHMFGIVGVTNAQHRSFLSKLSATWLYQSPRNNGQLIKTSNSRRLGPVALLWLSEGSDQGT
jgi:hypothetical protein